MATTTTSKIKKVTWEQLDKGLDLDLYLTPALHLSTFPSLPSPPLPSLSESWRGRRSIASDGCLPSLTSDLCLQPPASSHLPPYLKATPDRIQARSSQHSPPLRLRYLVSLHPAACSSVPCPRAGFLPFLVCFSSPLTNHEAGLPACLPAFSVLRSNGRAEESMSGRGL